MPYNDSDCALRCLAYHRGINQYGDGRKLLNQRTKELKKSWKQTPIRLEDIQKFENEFDIDIDTYTLCENGGCITRYISPISLMEPQHETPKHTVLFTPLPYHPDDKWYIFELPNIVVRE